MGCGSSAPAPRQGPPSISRPPSAQSARPTAPESPRHNMPPGPGSPGSPGSPPSPRRTSVLRAPPGLPHLPRLRIPRDAQVTQLSDAIADSAGFVGVVGCTGIGKTVLVNQAIRRAKILEVYGDRIFWVGPAGLDNLSSDFLNPFGQIHADLYNHFLTLGAQFATHSNLLKLPLTDATQALERAARELTEPVLVILDQIPDVEHLWKHSLGRIFGSAPGLAVVAIDRDRAALDALAKLIAVPEPVFFEPPRLTHDQARNLVSLIISDQVPNSPAGTSVLRATHYLPELAVVLGSLLMKRKRMASFERVIESIAPHIPPVESDEGQNTPKGDVRDQADALYALCLEGFEQSLQAGLRWLAVYPAGRRVLKSELHRVWDNAALDLAPTGADLSMLLSQHCIMTPFDDSSIIVHDLFREYARNTLDNSQLALGYEYRSPRPLHLASFDGDQRAIAELIKHFEVDTMGITATDEVPRRASIGEAEVPGDARSARGSIRGGVGDLEIDFDTPRFVTVAIGTSTRDNATPLWFAALRNRVDAAKALIAAEAEVDSGKAGKSGATPLFAAALSGFTAMAAALLDNGADIERGKFDSAATALYAAARGGFLDTVSLLLDRGADVDLGRRDTGESPLAAASRHAHPAVAKLLMERGANVNQMARSATPLTLACQCGSVELVRMLLAGGAHLDHDEFKGHPLFVASQNGFAEVVALLLEQPRETKTPRECLFIACQEGHLEVATRLIESGWDLEVGRADTGATPLYVTAARGHIDILRLLLAKGASVDAQASDGSTALFVASQNGRRDAALALLEAGADANRRAADGVTPLLAACARGHVDVVELLVKRGAEINGVRSSESGATAMYLAAQSGHTPVLAVLMDSGAELDNTQAADGACPLWIAAQNGHTEVVQLLLDRGSSVDQARKANVTPLMIASQGGRLDIVEELLKRGAALDNTASDTGASALYLASLGGHTAVTKALLEAGASPNVARTDTKETPLNCASKQGFLGVAKALLESGAEPAPLNLLYAAGEGHDTLIALLVGKGADVNFHDPETGLTPLMAACQGGHSSAAMLLLTHGADAGAVNPRSGSTALHMSVEGGYVEITSILLQQKGVNVNAARATDDGTPIWLAAKAKIAQLVWMLLEAGANPNVKPSPVAQAKADEQHEIFAMLRDKGAEDA